MNTNKLIQELENHKRKFNPNWRFDNKNPRHFVRLMSMVNNELDKLNKINEILK